MLNLSAILGVVSALLIQSGSAGIVNGIFNPNPGPPLGGQPGGGPWGNNPGSGSWGGNPGGNSWVNNPGGGNWSNNPSGGGWVNNPGNPGGRSWGGNTAFPPNQSNQWSNGPFQQPGPFASTPSLLQQPNQMGNFPNNGFGSGQEGPAQGFVPGQQGTGWGVGQGQTGSGLRPNPPGFGNW